MPLPRLAALLAVTGLVTVGQLVLAQVEFSENSSWEPRILELLNFDIDTFGKPLLRLSHLNWCQPEYKGKSCIISFPEVSMLKSRI